MAASNVLISFNTQVKIRWIYEFDYIVNILPDSRLTDPNKKTHWSEVVLSQPSELGPNPPYASFLPCSKVLVDPTYLSV